MEQMPSLNAQMAEQLLDKLTRGCDLLQSVFTQAECPSYLLFPIENARQSLFYAGCIFSEMLKKCASAPSESQTQIKDVETN